MSEARDRDDRRDAVDVGEVGDAPDAPDAPDAANAPDAPDAAVLRAEDFVTAFNAIDRELMARTGVRNDGSFREAANRFAQRNAWWRGDYEAMMAFGDLRNVIVHDRFRRFEYLSIPSPAVLDEIRAIRDRLLHPATAQAEFGRDVQTVDVGTTVAEMLRRVRDRAFTQYPVYRGDEFLGIVGGNGLSHWLAEMLRSDDRALIDLAEHTVGDLLAREEPRPNWLFMARDAPAAEVAYAFVERPQLEAVLITHDGRDDQKPLGIATQSDAAAWTG